MPARLLFVCVGNTCRSPIAEALAEARGVPAESAGVAAQRSDHAAPFAEQALQSARGRSLDDHTPRPVEAVDRSAVETVVAMDPGVARRLRADYDVAARLVTWTIPDPYGGALADYRYSLEQIDAALDRLRSD